MKKLALLLAIIMVFSLSGCTVIKTSPQITLVAPSEKERTIAAGRDFYVIARVDTGGLQKVEITLCNSDGKTVRAVESGAKDFKTDYEKLNAFNTGEAKNIMPDLVYDAKNPDSFSYAWNKCYFNNGYVIGLITGGVYQDYISHTNKDGTPFANINEGSYKIKIHAEYENGQASQNEFDITFGAVEEKITSRFSPQIHLDKVTAEAASKGYRVYNDLFAGYWSTSSIFGYTPYFAEILSKWHFENSLEYKTGDVHFYLYNVSKTCATNAVELATLQATQSVDTRLTVSYYTYGEPVLQYITDGTVNKLESGFSTLEQGDKLALTRAETCTETAADNYLNTYQPAEKEIDPNLSDGISASGSFAIFGIAAPIQNEPEQITDLQNFSYSVSDYIQKIHYTFVKEGNNETTEFDKNVGMTRLLDEGWEAYSIYEFMHVFNLEKGDYTLSLYGVDTNGVKVNGTDETMAVSVK